MFGKAVNQIQNGVEISGDAITGTLHYITGWTDFSSNPLEQNGNYLALKVTVDDPESTTTTVELVGGTKGPVTLDDDMNIVILVTNKDTQTVRVISTKDLESDTKNYSLKGLVLESV